MATIFAMPRQPAARGGNARISPHATIRLPGGRWRFLLREIY